MPLGMEVGLGPGDFVYRWGPISPPKKVGTATSDLRPMSIVATKRSPISATAELLLR